MSEPPDFDQIAKKVLIDQGVYEDYLGQLHIANALKEVWNARGAADRAALGEEFRRALMAPRPSDSVQIQPEEVLKALDA